jgi:outer membrane receptor protein involved in Fe transport
MLPVQGVSIQKGNLRNVSVTNKSGIFRLKCRVGEPIVLNFSHIGYTINSLSFKMPDADTTFKIIASEKKIMLSEAGVVASRPRQVITQTYSQTNIDKEIIEEKIATSLIDVLEEVPGITKRSEYHSPIVLRGLGGKRLLVTKDGNRRMGNFPTGFMGQGINIYDLDKVEVIKGPASVKYGPGAITGIINMESKYPFKKPGWHGRLLTSYASNNNEKTVIAGINRAGMDHAFSISARYRKADDFIYGKGEKALNSNYRDKDFRCSYTWENNHALKLTAESELHLGGPWGRPVGFNGTRFMRVTDTVDNTWHSSVTVLWRPEKKLKSTEFSVYYDREKRRQLKDSYDAGSNILSYREDVNYEDYYLGWRNISVLTVIKNLNVSFGTDGVFYRIKSPTILTDFFLGSVIKNKVSKDAGVLMAGVFSEAEYKSADKKLRLRGGLRADYSRINEGNVHDTLIDEGRKIDVWAWNGTCGIVYSAIENLFLSFQIARSCRMPDATEMFIMTSNADGIIYGNSSLAPEYGLNIDAGTRGTLGPFIFDFSLFSNFLHDFISLEYWENSGKKGINYTYYNIDKARIFGAEISLGAKFNQVFHPDNRFEYSGAFVFTRGDKLTNEPNWFSEGVPLRNIPPFNLNQSIIFHRLLSSSKSLYLGTDLRYYSTQNRIAPSEDGGYVSPSYCIMGVSAGYAYRHSSMKWDLKFICDNITDNKYRPFESIIYGMGRNLKISISFTF